MPSEKDLDEALHNGLKENRAFRQWFVQQLQHGHGHDRLVFSRSDNPWGRLPVILPNDVTGALEASTRDSETDVLAVFEDAAGDRLGVHIEDKLGPGVFTKYQPEQYAFRAEAWIGSEAHGSYSHWETVLVAPNSFIEANAQDAQKFTTRITHEDVGKFLPEFRQANNT
ncbi:MAG: hypothetical protein ACRDHZ_15650 [Ktedonobacteraceae bacterium]